MNEILQKIDASFRDATKGRESIKAIISWWGIPAYLFFYFIIDKLILAIDYKIFDIVLSAISCFYFAWHIFVLIKCSPKKPKLTKEEQRILREKKIKDAPKAFMRKLFLQEPVTKWNPVGISIAADLLFLANFFGYIWH